MSTIHAETGLRQTAASTRRIFGLLKGFLDALRERREREEARAALCALSDQALQDIGISRGEIDYVASNRSVDPRSILSRRDEHLTVRASWSPWLE